MNRKNFLRKGVIGLGSIIAIPTLVSSCKKEDDIDPNACETTVAETAGPFPIKSPADWVRANIIGDRTGIPLMITITVQNTNNGCQVLEGAFVDIWHCDAQGNYSQYGGQQDGDFTATNFLRGRQTTDANGNASFISIYPGWYPGRAPHIHFEVLTNTNQSLLVGQIAFPEDISNTVYASQGYNGNFDTSNSDDGIFEDSLVGNMADTVSGNTTDGYTLTKVVKVAG